MPLGKAGHQKPGRLGRTEAGGGEAALEAARDEAEPARHAQTDCGAADLLEQALARENMARAWKRVKANKGSAGVDGRTVLDTGEYLKTAWPDIRKALLDGSYRPDPVRRVGIPKPGGGVRELGILRAPRGCYAKLALRVNESKTAVAPAWGRKFLGYCFWATSKGEVRRAVADPAMDRLRVRIRQLTRRTRGCSLEQIAADLRDYVPGWKAYFRLAQTPKVMRELDEWLRHRLRAVQLKQWRRGPTIFRELRRLGAGPDLAARVAGNARRWWRNSAMGLNRVLTIAHFDRLGVPRFS
jgi:hypothetical protein